MFFSSPRFCLFFHWNFKRAFDYQSKPENYCKGHMTWKGKDLELSDSKWSFCFVGAKIYLRVEQNSELHGRAGVQSWCHTGRGPIGVIGPELERGWASKVSSSTLHLKSSNRDDSISLSQITGLIKYPVPCRVFLLLFKKKIFFFRLGFIQI